MREGREKQGRKREQTSVSAIEKRAKKDDAAANGGGSPERFTQPGEERRLTSFLETDNNVVRRQKKKQSTNYSDSQAYYHGLRNQGATCYLNSVLQVLFMTKDFREAVEKYCHDNPHTTHIDSELNILFETLKRHTTETHAITRRLGIQKVYKQQDAAEYFEKILSNSSLEASRIFHGKLIHSIVCCGCNQRTDTEGGFWSLQLPIKDGSNYSVVDGLEAFFSPSRVFGDDQLYCNHCEAKADASFECEVKEHPEVLMLLLKRFEFDYLTMAYIKILSCVEVPDTIQLPGNQNQLYEIFAVVDHMGSLGGGHYTSTIKSQDNGRWYKFNDASVSPTDMPVEGIKKSNTAYLLMYRKKKTNAPDTPIQEFNKEQSVEEPKLKGSDWDGDVNDREKGQEIKMGEMKEEPETLDSVRTETGDGAVGSVKDKKAGGLVEMPSREGDSSLDSSVRPEEGHVDADQDEKIRPPADLRQSSDKDKEESRGGVNDVRVDKEEGSEDESNEAVAMKPQVEDSKVDPKEAQWKTGDECSRSCKASEGIETETRCDNVKEGTEGGATKGVRSFIVMRKEEGGRESVKGKYAPHTEALLKQFDDLTLESEGGHHGVQTSSAASGDDGRKAEKSSGGKTWPFCLPQRKDRQKKSSGGETWPFRRPQKKDRQKNRGRYLGERSSDCASQQMSKRKREEEENSENGKKRIRKEKNKTPGCFLLCFFPRTQSE